MIDVSNTEDKMDSRDVIARIEDLEAELEGGYIDGETGVYMSDDDGDFIDMDDEYEELTALKALAAEAEDVCDWAGGEALIRDTYFKEYAEHYAEDIGAVANESQWPLYHIDWEAAADDLQQDFSSVDFDGVEYWVRSS